MSKKNRSISKGLLRRVAVYIRDNSVNGEYLQDEETMAHYLGLTVETVQKVIKQLLTDGLVIIKEKKDPAMPDIYIYKGEGAASNLVLEIGGISNNLHRLLNDVQASADFKNVFLDYSRKVQELLDSYQEQQKKVEDCKNFKDSIVRILEAPNGLIQVIAKRKP